MSDISLSFAIRRLHVRWLLIILAIGWATQVHAQDDDITKLKNLSIEELMDVQVAPVSRSPKRLSEAASAIQIISGEDIRRSGARSIPEALRLASNLQVSQSNSGGWIISARGFNTTFANKLLVMIDGRTVYTPLFGGVIWQLQNVLLRDVERIEVISGPGGTLWGANAMNGVINIITKKVKDTQGLYLAAAAGDFLKRDFGLRYGDSIGSKIHYRIYGQHSARNSTFLTQTVRNNDSWYMSQGGFDVDIKPTLSDYIVIQGDVYGGTNQGNAGAGNFDGQNLLGRWSHTISERSDFALQVYYDRYWFDNPEALADEMQTFDIDFQQRINIRANHKVLWGLGYRFVHDEVSNRISYGLTPTDRDMPLYTGFIHDEILLTKSLKFIVGTKLMHNVFSGFEVQPSARLALTFNKHNTLWAAVSRAVRAPSRYDVDYHLPLTPQPPNIPSIDGGPNFDSEKLKGIELGYRTQPNSDLSLSLSTFYNKYTDLYSVERLPNVQTLQIMNGSEAETWGAELFGFAQVTNAWRLRGGLTYFSKDLRAKPGHNYDPSYLSNDARHHFVFQSMLNLPLNFKFDVTARYVDYIASSTATARVPEYFTFDTRLAWQWKKYEVSLIGQNLWAEQHAEFGVLLIPRSFYARIVCRF
jgi:iron complex outermembrane recepter protein